MKFGIVFRPGNLWIGAHWSPLYQRLCITIFPTVTIWIARKGGIRAGSEINDRLRLLIKGWSSRARAKFQSAKMQPETDEFGRRFIEHGAVCYVNCARELEEFLETGKVLNRLALKDNLLLEPD